MSADVGGDIRLDIRESTPDRSPFTEPNAVSSRYSMPFEFASGSVHHVVPERSDEPFTGLERHLATTFARD